MNSAFRIIIIFCVTFCSLFAQAQPAKGVIWDSDGTAMYKISSGDIQKVDMKTGAATTLVAAADLKYNGEAVRPENISFSKDKSKILIFTNGAKVWRYKTRGDYYVYTLQNKNLQKLGRTLPTQSLMFAKFSPVNAQVAYVSGHNIYVEDLTSNIIRPLTTNGTRTLINGTFDWVYEEEFGCRDGFRWSPDGKFIAYWQLDASKIRDYYMLNTTDSVYSKVIPVEYPKVGYAPSPAVIKVVNAQTGTTIKMNIDGNPQENYLTRMEWASPSDLVIQQLDRKQQESKLIYAKATDGSAYTFWAEADDNAWVDMNTDNPVGWNWINQGKDFLWISEKDGWRHIYKISRDGKTATLLTKGNYDIEKLLQIDEVNDYVYFTASPKSAVNMYLYRVKINNPKSEPELVSTASQAGVHSYDIGPQAKYASHSFSNYNTMPSKEFIQLPDAKYVGWGSKLNTTAATNIDLEYTQVTTKDGTVLDAWIHKPENFDTQKKYPVVMYVYGEPAASVVMNEYGNHMNFLYTGNMAADGYIQVAIDNRGTPSLKSALWRKAIYRRIGRLNIDDMAEGLEKLLEKPYMDKDRVAVWGWSGGGSSTLNLLFKYPKLFKTGIAIAAVTDLLYYDNIYEERYMGLPQENMEDYKAGSAINFAQNLSAPLLYIHGTGDDNVHYSNAEKLINALVANNKQFTFMAYPNRSHSMQEGKGTLTHLSTLYTEFLRKNCPPGAK